MVPEGGKTDRSPEMAPLWEVIHETRALMHRLRAAGEDLYGQGVNSAGKRGVLFSLAEGPQTVPQMARARPVSRQHIQMLVNPLLRDGYVERIPNPAHKRSRLVRLTEAGRVLVADMRQREARVLRGLPFDLSGDELRRAARVLRTVRHIFESPEWSQVVEQEEAES